MQSTIIRVRDIHRPPMTDNTLLALSAILLLAFGLERLSAALKLPAVIILIATGLVAKPISEQLGLPLRNIDNYVPFLGTLGLILIVLEGALDIRLHRTGLRRAGMATLGAIGGFIVCMGLFYLLGTHLVGLPPYEAALLAVPFSVISSAIAIPSSAFLPRGEREYVIYESSISDIVGVLVFYSLLISDGTVGGALMAMFGGGVISLLLGAFSAVALVLILMRIDGHIRFIPLLAGILFLYAIGKLLHLSPLILVLLFGLALNNPAMLTRLRLFRDWFDESYDATLEQFKILVLELTFAVRGFFFILLGYWTNLADVASLSAWLAALAILSVIYGSRLLLLHAFRQPLAEILVWLAPRGLITVLLYLHARDTMALPGYLNGAVILVVLASSLLIIPGRIKGTRMSATTTDTDAS